MSCDDTCLIWQEVAYHRGVENRIGGAHLESEMSQIAGAQNNSPENIVLVELSLASRRGGQSRPIRWWACGFDRVTPGDADLR